MKDWRMRRSPSWNIFRYRQLPARDLQVGDVVNTQYGDLRIEKIESSDTLMHLFKTAVALKLTFEHKTEILVHPARPVLIVRTRENKERSESKPIRVLFRNVGW